ncbi:coenzyme F420-0:L-glutamate ligase [Anaerolineae bacterium CFX9]|jgi:coenzyme F420-0:L-glutamate ligase/coenzyme F420-1:gamma-L-glutamate ligase|nr:coenzyme F420-0:L-glutamate ligase [Anaerolineae bacterium CFX9]
MPGKSLIITPVEAPVREQSFDLYATLIDSLNAAEIALREGDVLAVSSKYVAISEGNVVRLEDVVVTPEAERIAERYQMNPRTAQLVLNEADHVFGGIPGFLLTHKDGIISPNAGIDRSNIPMGFAVLFPRDPYASAARLRDFIRERFGVRIGVILTDSWLMPGRNGTTGVALASAGFVPVQDERGKADLFGNPLIVTQRGVADQLCAAAELVMGERDEATPFVVIRNAGITLTDDPITVADVAIDWRMCIYVESLTLGLLEKTLAAPDTP